MSWEMGNAYILQIAELELQIQELNNLRDQQIESVKEEYNSQIAELATESENYTEKLKQIADNDPEFQKTRFKQFELGSIALENSCKVNIRSKDAAVNALKYLGQTHCIITKEEIDKERLKVLPENILKQAGISIKTEKVLNIKPDITKLKCV